MLARLTTHRETCFGTHQVAASCMKLSSDWMKQREGQIVHGSYVTCWKTSLRYVGPVKSATCRVFLKFFLAHKVELPSPFCNNLSQPAAT